MTPQSDTETPERGLRSLPRNVWATSFTSFFNDISSEMVINLLPLFLANVLGVESADLLRRHPPVIQWPDGGNTFAS